MPIGKLIGGLMMLFLASVIREAGADTNNQTLKNKTTSGSGVTKTTPKTAKPVPAENKQYVKEIFRQDGVEVRFSFQPALKQYADNCVIAKIKNLSKTKILKLETESSYQDQITGKYGSLPKIDKVTDNYGNKFRVNKIKPFISDVYPEETQEIRIEFYGRLIPNTKTFSVFVPEGVMGNSDWFNATVPVPVLSAPAPNESVKESSEANQIYSGPNLERIK